MDYNIPPTFSYKLAVNLFHVFVIVNWTESPVLQMLRNRSSFMMRIVDGYLLNNRSRTEHQQVNWVITFSEWTARSDE